MIHGDLEVLNIPAFALRVNSDRHRGACCESGAQQVERIGSEIFSAETLWFVTDQRMGTHRDAICIGAPVGLNSMRNQG